MNSPRLSVVMPVYNAERYLAQAIESILHQTFRDFEFIIFDDGSQDSSLRILEQYANIDMRIQLFAKSHKGYVSWLNEGIVTARGEFLARMDADDISLPQRFTRQVEYLFKHPACVVVGCGTLMIDSDGDPICEHRPDPDHATLFANLVKGGHGIIAHPTSMMRRTAIVNAGGYKEEYEPIEDFDLWFRLAECGELANIPEPLFKYRQHRGSIMYTRTQVERQKQYADIILAQARQRLGERPLSHSCYNYSAPTIVESHRMWATWALISRHRRTAMKHARLSLRHATWSPKSWALLFACLLPFSLLSVLSRFGLSRSWNKWNSFPA
jgi:glycosyltransferase involved in cell wall biosynthesis